MPAMNLTKNASFAANYHIKERKLNFNAVFTDKSVTMHYRKTKQVTIDHNRLHKRKRNTFCIMHDN